MTPDRLRVRLTKAGMPSTIIAPYRHAYDYHGRLPGIAEYTLDKTYKAPPVDAPDPCTVKGCVRVKGHAGFHCTSEVIAKREDGGTK